MQIKTSFKVITGLCLLVLFCLLHLFIGTTPLSSNDYWEALTNYNTANTNHIIARDLRIPRLMMALFSGVGLSVAGLLMQTLFKNPLAEPNILGVSTGSSLFVALTILTGVTFFQSDWGIIASALLGAFIFAFLILFFARFMKYQGSLLLIGIMLASFSSSFISIIQAYSEVNQLKAYTMWSMGSLQNVSFAQLPIIGILFMIGLTLAIFQIRSLNAFVLGAENASLLGINIKRSRVLIILVASILTGIITAFCGPIAFIGMAVPNLVKLIFKTQNHLQLLIGNCIIGALFMVLCDCIVQGLSNHLLLPINAITSMIGAPFVIYVIIKKWS